MKKDKSSKEVIQDLETNLVKLIDVLKGYKIDVKIINPESLINLVATRTPEIVIEIILVTMERIKLLQASTDFVEPGTKTMKYWELWMIDLPDLKKFYPSSTLLVFHWILLVIFARRFLLYVVPENKAPLYVRFTDLLEADALSKEHLDKALDNLAIFVNNIFKKKTGKYLDKAEAKSFVWETVRNAFPESIKESLIKATQRDKKISYVPNRAADRLSKFLRKGKQLLWEDIQKDLPENLRAIEFVPDIPKLVEAEKTSSLIKWIESIKDPQDREIARLKHQDKLTVRQIADKLSIPRSTIQDRLKKLKPPF